MGCFPRMQAPAREYSGPAASRRQGNFAITGFVANT